MKQKVMMIAISFLLGGILGFLCVKVILSNPQETASLGASAKQENPAKQKTSAMQTPVPVTGSGIQTLEEDETLDAGQQKQDSVGRIDYPLIDLYFEHDKTYKIVIREYMMDTVVDEYEAEGDFFQFNKEYISIVTCPSGRGTTPPFMFEIYEGDTLIKNIDCFEVRDGVLDDKWREKDNE